MQYENKILVSAVLIIAVALISFNLVNPNISGRVGAWNVDCDSISVRAERDGVWVVATILNPLDSPGTDYNGPGELWVYYYDSSRRREGRQPIDHGYVNDHTIQVSIRDLAGKYEWVSVRDKCTNQKVLAAVEEKDYV